MREGDIRNNLICKKKKKKKKKKRTWGTNIIIYFSAIFLKMNLKPYFSGSQTSLRLIDNLGHQGIFRYLPLQQNRR